MFTPSRLPVDHPEFRYSPSLNPYQKKIKSKGSKGFVDHEPEHNRGNWRQLFESNLPKDSKLHLEIGCNAGHLLTELAFQNPSENFIGIDWKWKVVFRAIEKGEKKKLKNLLMIRAHAERIGYFFDTEELDSISVFFPDPWEKKSQNKNRFLKERRFLEFHRILKPHGLIHIKTDHLDYFEWIQAELSNLKTHFEIQSLDYDLHKNNPDSHRLRIPQITLFESIFIREKKPIYQIKILKK